jgi:hypothetical protein
MKRTFVILLILAFACKQDEPALLQCKLVGVQETLQYLTSEEVLLTKIDFKYTDKGLLQNMEVNSNSSNKRSSYSVNVSPLPNNEFIYEYRYADGVLAIDTVKMNAQNYRIQIRKRFSGGIQNIFDYSYDAVGSPTTIVQRDQNGKVLAMSKWVVENGNLMKYQTLKDNVYQDAEVYEYDSVLPNDRLFYIGNYQWAYNLGKPPKKILLSILKGKNEYIYNDPKSRNSITKTSLTI